MISLTKIVEKKTLLVTAALFVCMSAYLSFSGPYNLDCVMSSCKISTGDNMTGEVAVMSLMTSPLCAVTHTLGT